MSDVCWRTYWKGWPELRPRVWADYCRDLALLDLTGGVETEAELEQILTPYAPVGPSASAISRLRKALHGRHIASTEVVRPWDSAAWPKATQAFFQVQEAHPRVDPDIRLKITSAWGNDHQDADNTANSLRSHRKDTIHQERPAPV